MPVARFDILMVMSSIILGLAVAELFRRITNIISNSSNLKLHWIPFGYSMVVFMLILSRWWVLYRWEPIEEHISYFHFLFLLTFPVLLFVSSTLILPVVQKEVQYDLLDHFYQIRKWFFGAIILTILLDYLETMMKGWAYFTSLGTGYLVLGALVLGCCVLGATTKTSWVHAIAMTILLGVTLLHK